MILTIVIFGKASSLCWACWCSSRGSPSGWGQVSLCYSDSVMMMMIMMMIVVTVGMNKL